MRNAGSDHVNRQGVGDNLLPPAGPRRLKVLTCTCRGTMPYAPRALAAACGAEGNAAHELCRADIGRFRAALGDSLLVTCTQEAPAFLQAQEEAGGTAPLHFVNIREHAGWSDEAPQALPKVAALVAQAEILSGLPEAAVLTLNSGGVTLIYGSDDRALDAARQLADRLDLTVMLTGPAQALPPQVWEFPVIRGTINRRNRPSRRLRADRGWFRRRKRPRPEASFRLRKAARRSSLALRYHHRPDRWGPALRGSPRDGYLRADPASPVAVQKVLFAASDLVGEFDKPQPVVLEAPACAHERSGQNGCNRCLDHLPGRRHRPSGRRRRHRSGDLRACGNCAAVCPTDAIRWMRAECGGDGRRLRALLAAYRRAGGKGPPVLLLHDAEHGERLISALARVGAGLPARVIPVLAPRVLGLDALAAGLCVRGGRSVGAAAGSSRRRRERGGGGSSSC